MTVLLRTEGVRKAYGGVHALDTCTVEVEEGTVAGLIGPNGSGKTTLFNVITGYAKADAGHVYLAGRKITNLSPDKVFALGIGRTFQLTRIFPRLTVLENMIVAAQHTGGLRGVARFRNPLARAGGPGDRAGLRTGDVLLRFDGRTADSIDLFALRHELERPDVTHHLTVRRGTRIDSVQLRTATRP